MENEIIQQLDVISKSIEKLDTIAKNIQALAEPKFIEYIALLISFISVIVSGLAIWFAVQVPKKIADRQDKIALFEKKYEAYDIICKCQLFAVGILASEQTKESIKSIFIRAFYPELSKDDELNLSNLSPFYLSISKELVQIKLLFPPEVSEHMNTIIITFLLLLDTINSEETDKDSKEYLDMIKQRKALFLDAMENDKYKRMISIIQKELNIGNIER